MEEFKDIGISLTAGAITAILGMAWSYYRLIKRVRFLELKYKHITRDPFLCETCHEGMYRLISTGEHPIFDEWQCNDPTCHATPPATWRKKMKDRRYPLLKISDNPESF